MQSHTKNRNDAPQRETIEHIRQKIRKVTGQDPVFGAAPDCPPEIEEEFLRNVLAFEAAPKRPLFDVLVDSGIKEEERQMYAGIDPHLQIPAHCDPAYRRDQLLEDLNRGITGIPS